MENGFVKVVSPIDDTPADKAGILPEDLIISVDGESIVGLTLNDAVEKLRGPIGSNVRFPCNALRMSLLKSTLSEMKLRSDLSAHVFMELSAIFGLQHFLNRPRLGSRRQWMICRLKQRNN